MTNNEMKIASLACCPWCDKTPCVGALNCEKIKGYLEKGNEPIDSNEGTVLLW